MALDHEIVRLAWGGRLVVRRRLVAIVVGLCAVFWVSAPTLGDWFATNSVPMVAGMATAVVIYLPTIVFLWFLDRRTRTPLPAVVFVLLAIWLVFGPLAGTLNDWLGRSFPLFTFVGLTEEFCKVAPLLIILIVLPRAVSGARDGLILGGLGGLAFAILEFGYYVAHVGFDDVGWTSLTNQFGRGNVLGTHNHVVWSAALGAALGQAVSMAGGWRRIALPIAAYVAVALLHSLQDGGGNVAAVMLAGVLLEPVLLAFPDPEAVMNNNMTMIQLYFGTVNPLMINCVLLPILWVVIRRSGDTERRIIRDQLRDEAGQVITRTEFGAVACDQRYKTRKLTDLTGATAGKIVQLQNELAFHKQYLARSGGNVEGDPPVLAVRAIITRLRGNSVRSA